MKKLNGNEHNQEMPRIGEHDADVEFDVGDNVVVDLGMAGQLGPGEITDKIQYESKYDEFIGYIVLLKMSEDESMSFGWVGSSLLAPSTNSSFPEIA